MSEIEKAEELVNKFKDYVHGYVGSSMLTNHEYPEQILAQAKRASIIAVDEILKELDQLRKPEYTAFVISYDTQEVMQGYEKIDYWNNVKTEIEKL